MRVRELMRQPVTTVRPDDDLTRAAHLLTWQAIRHLPVVDEGRVVGVLTERDIVKHQDAVARGDAVRTVMSTPPQVIRPDEDVSAASARMSEDRIGCLPVVDEGGVLIGILATADLLAANLRSVDRPIAGEGGGRRVGDVMTEMPEVAQPDEFLVEALGRMADLGVRHLPVVDDTGRVVGVLSERAVGDVLAELLVATSAVERREAVYRQRVRDAARANPPLVQPGTSMEEAARTLAASRVYALPVVDENGRLRGILTAWDLLQALGQVDAEHPGHASETPTTH